jgi:DNA replication and repair protein RecF
VPLDAIGFRSFRNLVDARVLLDARFNLVVGSNAQGKTSLLEAVYVLGTGKSFRSSHVKEVLRWGEDSAALSGALRDEPRTSIDIELTSAGKRYQVDGERVGLTSFLGTLTPVAFGAEAARLTEGPPAARRTFLDGGVLALEPSYLRELSSYAEALRQKNRLLSHKRTGGPCDRRTLAAYNVSLARHGASLVRHRTAWVERLKKKLPR